jgi:hypothetical protein
MQPLTVSVKEKGGKPDKNHTVFPMVKEIHTETYENSQDYAQKPQ